ncbi:unnamed protein product [Nezara viridula]|uniref:Neuropeptide n=1 Tax=Nezara viridula TaxID=85310 RepID=A0A9P0EBE7_NEZVI|nr:unnamed protein product [Nezara viridula]
MFHFLYLSFCLCCIISCLQILSSQLDKCLNITSINIQTQQPKLWTTWNQ